MIDVIIPAYNSHDTIVKTLQSICVQDISDMFNVYICNDGSEEDYSKIVKEFNKYLNITELKLKKNSGPGAARQYGLDHSSGTFVVFIDADDQFYTPVSIKTMYNFITNDESDLVICSFLEETDEDYINHPNDATWLHGKMYRRSFIEKYNIKFSNTYANEDNYFNKLFLIRNPKITYLDDIAYLWKNNENSLTRKNDKEYKVTGTYGLIDNLIAVVKEVRKTDIDKRTIANYTYSFFIAIYFYYLEYYDDEKAKDYIKKSKKLKDYYVEYYNMYPEDLDTVFKSQLEAFSVADNYMRIIKPVVTFDEFIKLYEE